MPIVDVVPAIDQGIVVVHPPFTVIHDRRGALRARSAPLEGLPWLVLADEMDRSDTSTEAFIRRSIPGETDFSQTLLRYNVQKNTHVYAAVGVVLYTKLSLFQS